MASEVKMATGANIKQGNSRSSSITFPNLQRIGSSCPCRGSTLLQSSARTTYHSSISANFETKWGKREQLAASSIFFLIKLYCLRKGDRTELATTEQQWWLAGPFQGFWIKFSPWINVTNSLSTRTVLNKCWHKTGERAIASTPVLFNREFSSNPLAHGRATAGHSAPQDLPSRGRKWGSVSQRAAQGWEQSQPCPPSQQPNSSCRVIPRWTFLAFQTAHPAIHVTGNEW